MKSGFDSTLYMREQTKAIRERIEKFGNKLYLEFGGKLFDDYHAARVLPGFDVNAKIKLLQNFKDQAEVVFCINAADIVKSKIRADFGITYEKDLLRTIDAFRNLELSVNSVVVTQYEDQPSVRTFRAMLENRGIKTYAHYKIPGYPANVDLVVSDKGYGANDYIETTRPLVIITAPGPCSGKLATCLSQLYHENKRGISAGYAKFETFPVWNLPLKHPVNLAYEAATADLNDVNMIDPFHLEAYGTTAVNYNRDIDAFPVLRMILQRITGDSKIYSSPTDMGVNMVKAGIVDDDAVRYAAKQEVIRRYYKYSCECLYGRCDETTIERVEMLMNQLDLTHNDRAVVAPTLERSERSEAQAVGIEMEDGTIVTGKASDLLSAASACVLNAVKIPAGLSDELHLLSPITLEPILKTKRTYLHSTEPLNLSEMLIALSICAATNPTAELAVSKLACLRGCEAHSTAILSTADEKALRNLGLNVTCEPEFATTDLYNG